MSSAFHMQDKSIPYPDILPSAIDQLIVSLKRFEKGIRYKQKGLSYKSPA
jgi:hypothetical protein